MLVAKSSPSRSPSRSDLAPQADPLRSGHPREEILTLQVLHGEIRLSFVLAKIVNGNDVLGDSSRRLAPR